ncbi:protein NRT1/ PTR FAMILY 6.2-like [Pyrus ussuriensis x Pyrus communis]|uniref:Protein NRT1/ PTR FAMILY 6.2-like n=1 Tax=Pyrus ussuriensis x Pyrus communis TaxID=2448454 RepID=A0A5N5GVK1_9ROSA|nr:protein NRT1/ PTR FAMILY 6.2-like [Pyrus ussuriensis x Pyrus communis]
MPVQFSIEIGNWFGISGICNDRTEGGKMGWTVAGAVDYKGFPANNSRTGGWVAAALILGIEICERLSTMGIAVNLVTYLVGTMHLPSATAANIVTDFVGTSFLLCLLGGFLADSFLGRYNTIAIFASIQTLGMVGLAISVKLPQLRPPHCDTTAATNHCKEANGFQMGILYLALYIIALGIGGLKSSVSGFGTDQFDEKDDKEKAQMSYFFNRFFLFISTGTLMAVTVLVYVQDEVDRSLAYGICSVSMFIAIVVFFAGTKRYRYKKSSGSPIVQNFQVVVAAIRKRKMKAPLDIASLYENNPEASRIDHTDQFRFLDKAAVVVEGDFEEGNATGSSTAKPWKLRTVTRVEEVKMMVRLLPIWATTIMFWTAYAQMITFSVEQASTMERSIRKFQIPAGSLTVFFVLAIMITLAFNDRVIMPLWKKWNGQPGFTNLQRIAIGLVLSTIGMAAAALSERKRLSVAKSARSATGTLPISVFLLIPQFFLVGSGEAFIYTGQLDFFITKSPKGMKTMSTGLFLSTLSLGFFVSSLLVSIVKSVTGNEDGQGWLADNINYGRLDCFYGLLTVLSVINFVAYLVCARWSHKTHKQHAFVLQMASANALILIGDYYDANTMKYKIQTKFAVMMCNNTGFTKLQKMAIGLVLANIGMGAAALGERKKLAVAKTNGGLSPLPIRVFLLPQFLAGGCRWFKPRKLTPPPDSAASGGSPAEEDKC